MEDFYFTPVFSCFTHFLLLYRAKYLYLRVKNQTNDDEEGFFCKGSRGLRDGVRRAFGALYQGGHAARQPVCHPPQGVHAAVAEPLQHGGQHRRHRLRGAVVIFLVCVFFVLFQTLQERFKPVEFVESDDPLIIEEMKKIEVYRAANE